MPDPTPPRAHQPDSRRRRHALVGTGSRAQMYLEAIAGAHAAEAELVAVGDTNPGRAAWSLLHHPALGSPAVVDLPGDDGPAALVAAVTEHAVDRVIVTTPDATHAAYVVAALEAGADVVVEKPLTTTEAGVRAIAEAAERTGRQVTITFNYRYAPRNTALKQVVASGQLGEVTSIHFEWVLDTAHGADYFRRWHRDKATSGGLLVHKSSHHFDLVGWWLDDVATRVYASGGLRFYGADNAAARGLGDRPARGTLVEADGAEGPRPDAFSLDLRADPTHAGLYLEQEHHDGYLRDRDVFDPGITIEDNLSLVVDYARGASMSYSLNAHSPWEGYTVAVNGTLGRAELTVVERGAVLVDDGRAVVDPSARPDLVPGEAGPDDDARPVGERLLVQRHFAPAREVEIPTGEGGHGGGDAVLLRDVFAPGPRGHDPLGHAADWTDGVRAVVVGLAGNRSLTSGQAVATADLDLGPATAALARSAR